MEYDVSITLHCCLQVSYLTSTIHYHPLSKFTIYYFFLASIRFLSICFIPFCKCYLVELVSGIRDAFLMLDKNC